MHTTIVIIFLPLTSSDRFLSQFPGRACGQYSKSFMSFKSVE